MRPTMAPPSTIKPNRDNTISKLLFTRTSLALKPINLLISHRYTMAKPYYVPFRVGLPLLYRHHGKRSIKVLFLIVKPLPPRTGFFASFYKPWYFRPSNTLFDPDWVTNSRHKKGMPRGLNSLPRKFFFLPRKCGFYAVKIFFSKQGISFPAQEMSPACPGNFFSCASFLSPINTGVSRGYLKRFRGVFKKTPGGPKL